MTQSINRMASKHLEANKVGQGSNTEDEQQVLLSCSSGVVVGCADGPAAR